MPALRSTTVLLVRHGNRTVIASDGQVTLNDTVLKSSASKVKRISRDGSRRGAKPNPERDIVVGFAGGAADGLALFTRFEGKLEEARGNLEKAVIELAKDWRTDRVLRQLQAVMVIASSDQSFLLSGNGDLMQPDDQVLAIGSGANFATAAARALLRHSSLETRQIVEEAMKIAAEICIYTNDNLTIEEIGPQ